MFLVLFYRDFCVQVTTLLKELLKVHPEERLSFEEFFSRVEELTKNNVELIDAVFGDVQRVNLSRFTRFACTPVQTGII